MKKIFLYTALISVFIIVSCSEEDDSLVLSDTTYFPLEVGNSWTYENRAFQNDITSAGNETLSVDTRNGNEFNFSQNIDEIAGVFTSVLASGEVSKTSGNQSFVYNGEVSISLENDLPDLEIPLENLVLYDSGLSQGDVMSSSSGEFQQSINGFPVDFNYVITSTHNGFSAEEVINSISYEDVFISKTEVSLSASVFIVFNNFTILQEQPVTTITNYYAKDVGLIFSDVEIEIIFEDIPEQLEVEIPDIFFRSIQRIDDYVVNLNL